MKIDDRDFLRGVVAPFDGLEIELVNKPVFVAVDEVVVIQQID